MSSRSVSSYLWKYEREHFWKKRGKKVEKKRGLFAGTGRDIFRKSGLKRGMVSHQGGLSSGWSFIRTVSHYAGLSSGIALYPYRARFIRDLSSLTENALTMPSK